MLVASVKPYVRVEALPALRSGFKAYQKQMQKILVRIWYDAFRYGPRRQLRCGESSPEISTEAPQEYHIIIYLSFKYYDD